MRATGEQQELGKYEKLFPERLGISQLNLWQSVVPAAVGHQGSLGPGAACAFFPVRFSKLGKAEGIKNHTECWQTPGLVQAKVSPCK